MVSGRQELVRWVGDVELGQTAVLLLAGRMYVVDVSSRWLLVATVEAADFDTAVGVDRTVEADDSSQQRRLTLPSRRSRQLGSVARTQL